MMAHSFYSYKEGYVVHHKNFDKTDNRRANLMYLTPEDHCRLHKIGNKYTLGMKHSPESIQKIREAKQKKPVYCWQLYKVFESVQAAARELKLSASHICQCCKGKRKICGGFHFNYYSEEQK